MIDRISETEFVLHGLPTNMRANLDDEALYEGDDRGRQSERSRDLRGGWLRERGWDAYDDADGNRKPWYPGFDLPAPIMRVTRDNQEELDAQFFAYRVRKAVEALPEGVWLTERGLWDDAWVATYKTAGNITIAMQDPHSADQFAATFLA